MGILSRIGDKLNISESIFCDGRPRKSEIERALAGVDIAGHSWVYQPPTFRTPYFYVTCFAVPRYRKQQALQALRRAGIKAH